MNQKQFLEILTKRLRLLPKDEFLSIIHYYEEYFIDAGAEKAQIELGNPNLLADKLLDNRPEFYTAHELLKEDISRRIPIWFEFLFTFTFKFLLVLIFIGLLYVLGGINEILLHVWNWYLTQLLLEMHLGNAIVIIGIMLFITSLFFITFIPLMNLIRWIWQLSNSLVKQVWNIIKGGIYHA